MNTQRQSADDASTTPSLSQFDYQLPADLIAQRPLPRRSDARLLVYRRGTDAVEHHHVRDLPDLLDAGDLLVGNRSQVIPARLLGRKRSGGAVELLLVHPLDEQDDRHNWRCMIRGRVHPGSVIELDGGGRAEVRTCHEDGARDCRLAVSGEVLDYAQTHGRIPLPPYIDRDDDEHDRERYQCVFADRPGSVAAPTAGLHLDHALLDRLRERGVERTLVDLAVGPGTFKPVQDEWIETHPMHAERCSCDAEACAAIAACRQRGGRVVAVGTTVVRTLESALGADGRVHPFADWTRIFLHPPKRVRSIDALLTNFHLPRSTLLMLVACLTGTARLRALYAEAVRERYRFYSYGDAMLILP